MFYFIFPRPSQYNTLPIIVGKILNVWAISKEIVQIWDAL